MVRQPSQVSRLSNFYVKQNQQNWLTKDPISLHSPVYPAVVILATFIRPALPFAFPGRDSSSWPPERFNSHYPALTSSKDHTSFYPTALFRPEGEPKSHWGKK